MDAQLPFEFDLVSHRLPPSAAVHLIVYYHRAMSKTVKAFAKINLGLRVLQKRPDGYHEIETFFQSIDLHDTLTLELLKKPEIRLEIVSPWALPQGRENLVYRAAETCALSLAHTSGGAHSSWKSAFP
jgi:4-diphosphocytidyl-2C-methyl-D-erythritol kinase